MQDSRALGEKIEELKEDHEKIENLILKKFNAIDADMDLSRKVLSSQVENVMSLLKVEEKSFNAVFIEGENDAFNALTEAVNRAKKLVKTTRFSPYSVVNRHDKFFTSIQQATGRLSDRLFRIIAVNSHEKLKEVNQLVANNVKRKLTIVLTEVEYSFEIVVIDDEEAFIHFRRADQPNCTNRFNIACTRKTCRF